MDNSIILTDFKEYNLSGLIDFNASYVEQVDKDILMDFNYFDNRDIIDDRPQYLQMRRQADFFPPEHKQGNFVLIRNERIKKQFYKAYYQVFYKGDLFGDIFLGTKPGTKNRSDEIKFQIYNEPLQTVYCKQICEEFMRTFDLKYNHLIRIDIAIDGVQLDKFLDKFRRKKIEIIGSQLVQTFEKNNKIETITIGKRTNGKMVRIYNKSADLKRSNKGYIKQVWENNGIDTSEDIWRYETELRRKVLKKYEHLTWEETWSEDTLVDLSKTGAKSFFEWVATKSKIKRKANRRRIEFMKWDNFGAALINKIEQIPAQDFEKLKRTGKVLEELSIKFNEPLLSDISDICYELIGAQDYKSGKLAEWHRQWNLRFNDHDTKYRNLFLNACTKDLRLDDLSVSLQ